MSKEIHAQCAASVLMGKFMVAVVTEGRAERSGTWTRLRERVPFSAPYRSTIQPPSAMKHSVDSGWSARAEHQPRPPGLRL